jgi:Flp pilus assembly protein CpaB
VRRQPIPRRLDLALALRRHPRAHTALVVTLALICGLVVHAIVRSAEEARSAWGNSVTVLVATRDVLPGEMLDAANTRLERRPEPLVGEDPLRGLPTDARVAAALYAGEIVRGERLAAAGASAVAARLPSDTRAMAVPADPATTPPLTIGDRVDVVVALAAEAAGDGPPGFLLAADVMVVDVSDVAVTVAVPTADAPRLAVALGAGAVTLGLRGS